MAKTVETKKVTKVVAEKKVAVAPKTETKAVKKPAEKKAEPKTEKPKADYKAIAENVEKAFKSDKTVDVIADSNMEYPRSTTEGDYKYIHFFNPGTEKNMFGCYIQTATTTKFAISNKVVEYLDKSVKAVPVVKKIKDVEKTAYYVVECKNEEIVDIAKKIIPAYQQMVLAKPKKTKVEKKSTEAKAE